MDRLTGECLQKMARAAFIALERENARINGLNVFPVPDGDTGTNMALTLKAAVDGPASNSLHEYARGLADLSLRGARGNSGTILSQFFYGFYWGVRTLDSADSFQVAQALQEAANTAYRAVAVPQEGTMLTVGRVAAEAAMIKARAGGNVIEVFESALKGALESLEQTPEMLPVLKEAGVVDAGGEGLVVCVTAALRALQGDTPAESEPTFNTDDDISTADPHAHFALHPTDVTFKYCTEFLVSGEDVNLDEMRTRLDPLGDSLMVVGNDTLVKVHIHTNQPGQALEIGGVWGDLTEISIENMQEQNRESVASGADVSPKEKADVAVVAVSFGSGFHAILKSLGARQLVPATPMLKPSAGQLQEAIERALADQIVLIPAHKDVLLAARQAANLSAKQVAVIEALDPLTAIHALLQFDSEAGFEENVRDMGDVVNEISVLEITQAARATIFQGVQIDEGDYFALRGDQVVATDIELFPVLRSTIEACKPADGSLITLYYGESISEDEAAQHGAKLQKLYGHHVEFETYSGGQSAYDYWISIE